MTLIDCRARVAEGCLHGELSRKQFGAGYMEGTLDPPLSEDGTYKDGTIVCDVCYMALGQPLNGLQMELAIEAAQHAKAS